VAQTLSGIKHAVSVGGTGIVLILMAVSIIDYCPNTIKITVLTAAGKSIS
jgi:hypothetical protein